MTTTDRLLHEPRPLSPIFITEVNHTDNRKVYSFEYTPEESGMYSIILEVCDRANNSKYVRRLVLFDKDSNITMDEKNKIFAGSAQNLSDFRWQTKIQNGANGTTRVSLLWPKHFTNKFHADKYLLNRVNTYPPQLNDFGRRGQGYKKIVPSFDDNEGRRQLSKISHFQGIVRFDIATDILETTETLGQLSMPSFIEVTPFEERTEVELTNITDGSAVQIWVRAHDIIGNKNIDSTKFLESIFFWFSKGDFKYENAK